MTIAAAAPWLATHAAVATSVAALIAAACWGAGDFSGGFASRRASALQIIALAHGADVLLLGAWLAFAHVAPPDAASMAWGLGSGLVNGFALAAFYMALAGGQMGLAAALGGVLTAAVPVIFDARLEGFPTAWHLAGFVLAAGAIFLLTRPAGEDGHNTSRRSIWLACAAGIGFGIFLVMSRQASRQQLVWPLLASRAGSTLVASAGLLALRRVSADLRWRKLTAQAFWLAMVAGLMDAFGNLCFMWAARAGRLDAASVLASLYPAGTIVLAMLVLREKFTRTQGWGVALALAAVALISKP